LTGFGALLYFQMIGKVKAGVRNTAYQSIFASVSNFLNQMFFIALVGVITNKGVFISIKKASRLIVTLFL